MVDFINYLIDQVSDGMIWVVNLLPNTPFKFDSQFDNSVLKAMNYFLPINQAISHLVLYTGAVFIYYGLRVILRWLKVANS